MAKESEDFADTGVVAAALRALKRAPTKPAISSRKEKGDAGRQVGPA